MRRWVCYGTSALLVAGAGAFLIFADDKGLGIFLVLVAATIARMLSINVAERTDT